MSSTIDEFLQSVAGPADIRLQVGHLPPPRDPEKVDALFGLPLLALVVMVVARNESLNTGNAGRKVAALLVEYFHGLRDARRILEWSPTLRRRTAQAIAFLEAARLATISPYEREMTLTAHALKLIAGVRRDDATDLGQLVRGLVRAQEKASARWEDQ